MKCVIKFNKLNTPFFW